jgi:hypothetical protein
LREKFLSEVNTALLLPNGKLVAPGGEYSPPDFVAREEDVRKQ